MTPVRIHHRLLVSTFVVALTVTGGLTWRAVGPQAVPVGDTVRDSSWSSPLPGELDTRRLFDQPAQVWSAGHRGVDLAAFPGATVLAPRTGIVTFAGTVVDRPVLTITHADGLRSSLEPVTASVAVGDRVELGEPVGVISGDRTHCDPDETCLHWGVRSSQEYLDPLLLLSSGPIVLLSRTDGADTLTLAGSLPVGVDQSRSQPHHGRGVYLGDP